MRNKVKVRCETFHYVALINALRSKQITVQNVEISSSSIEFVLAYKDFKIAKEIAKGIGYDIVIVRYFGIRSFFVKFCANIGFVSGIVIGLAMAIVASQLLVVINVECDNLSYKYEVQKILEDNYISPICFKNVINTDKVENLILSKLEEATFVTVQKKGFSLQINVQYRENPIKNENSNTIIASQDGIITRVVLSSGTALVKANDSVRKGQELVKGQFNLVDTAGEPTGEIVPCKAVAEIYAKVYYSGQFYLPDYVMENEKNDKAVVLKELYLGNTLIGKPHKVPFERYECITGEISLTGLIPFKVKTYTYYNITEKRIEKEEYKERILYKFREEVLNSLPTGSNVLNNWMEIKTINNMEMLSIHYEVEQRIDVSS